MIAFGMPHPTVQQKISHLCVRKFVPVYWREFADGPLSGTLRYDRGAWNYLTPQPTSKPKTLWAIWRARRAKVGQLKFL